MRNRAAPMVFVLFATVAVTVAGVALALPTFGGDRLSRVVLGDAPSAAPSPPMRCGEGDPIEDLGGGGYASWLADDADCLDEAMTSPLATVVIHGRDNEDIVATVKATASIGSIRDTISEESFSVPAKTDVTFALDLAPVFGMHDDQYSYPTIVRAAVGAAAVASHKITAVQALPSRLVVLRQAEGPAEIHDAASFKEAFPYGVTTEQEAERMLGLLTPEELAAQGGIFLSGASRSLHTTLDEELNRLHGEGK